MAVVLVPLVAMPAGAATGTGALTLMSTSSTGVKADYGAQYPTISDDGSFVVFESSNSTNLVAGLTNRRQVYVKNVRTGTTSVASTAADGTPGDGLSRTANVSGNGRYVAFLSDSTNLAPAASGWNVYVKDLLTGAIEVANRDASGTVVPGASQNHRVAVSDDGDVVAFVTRGPLVAGHTAKTCDDGEGGFYDCTPLELYVKRLSTEAVTALTLLGPTGSSVTSTHPVDMTSDGSTLVMSTMDALVAHDQDGQSDAYVIALDHGVPTGTPILVSTQYDGQVDPGLDRAERAKISNDGTRVVYDGIDNQLPGGYPNTQVFVKDLSSGTLQVLNPSANGWSQSSSISPDGGFVAFETNASNLLPADSDSTIDVLLKSLSTGAVTLISRTDAGTKGNKTSAIPQVTAGGAAVVFTTASTNLDPTDYDVHTDVYLKTLFEPAADANGDGITDDLQPAGTSLGSFVDTMLASPFVSTTGSIVNRYGLSVTVTDAADPDGVRIVVGTEVAGVRAELSVCGLPFTLKLSPGTDLVLTCGSVTVDVAQGAAEITAPGDEPVVVLVPAATKATVSSPTGEMYEVSHLGGSGTVVVEVGGTTTSLAPGDGPALVDTNVAPSIATVTVPTAPLPIGGDPVVLTAAFSDAAGDEHECIVDWGDGTTTVGAVDQSGDRCDAEHAYATAGVFPVSVAVTDDSGATGSASAVDYVVVYDPTAGFVTGGGWIDSPAGAYTTDPALTGKAEFGFVAKYQKQATVPTGTTAFQFKVAGLAFQSTSYDWLVVTGGAAKFKGTGTVNGIDGYRFQIWAGDGGKSGADTFRIKIWTEDAGGVETVVYDNTMAQPLGGGSIVIHK